MSNKTMNAEEIKEAKKFLESKGYEFEPDEFWGEEYISNEHKWKDICQLMADYAKQQQAPKPEVSEVEFVINEVQRRIESIEKIPYPKGIEAAGVHSELSDLLEWLNDYK